MRCPRRWTLGAVTVVLALLCACTRSDVRASESAEATGSSSRRASPSTSAAPEEGIPPLSVLQLSASGLSRPDQGRVVASKNNSGAVLIFDLAPVCDPATLWMYAVEAAGAPTRLAAYPGAVFDPQPPLSRYSGATLLSNRPRATSLLRVPGWTSWDVTDLLETIQSKGYRIAHDVPEDAPVSLEVRPPRFNAPGVTTPGTAWYFSATAGTYAPRLVCG